LYRWPPAGAFAVAFAIATQPFKAAAFSFVFASAFRTAGVSPCLLRVAFI
jgi:hypothetical protein